MKKSQTKKYPLWYRIYKVLYWKTRGGVLFAWEILIDIASKFVDPMERKYFRMNAVRCLRDWKTVTRALPQEFALMLDENRSDMYQNSRERRKLIADYARCARRYGIVPEEYFADGFHKLDDQHRNYIVSRWRQFHIVCSLDPASKQYLIDDKAIFIRTFADYLGRTSLNMEDGTTSYEQFESLLSKNDRVLVKPSDGGSGIGIYSIETAQLMEQTKRALFEDLSGRKMLIEEYIRQSGVLHDLAPDSVNTVRIATLFDGENVEIPFAFLRTGRLGSVTDNLHSGGIVWPIDHNKGVVSSKGYDTSGIEYEVHPDTNIRVVGLIIPCWTGVQNVVKEAAKRCPELKYISWDVVVSNDIISIIEANASGGVWRPYSADYDMWGYFKKWMDRVLGEDRPMRYFESDGE